MTSTPSRFSIWFMRLFSLIGIAAVIGVLSLCWMFRSLDGQAFGLYWNMAASLARNGDIGEATTWKVKVAEGVSYDDVDESLKALAAEFNIKDVGQLPLGDQITAMTGKTWRKLKIYQYCQPLVAKEIIDHAESFSAYLPCRISLVEDKKGQLWLYTQNMDMMIHGGNPLPPALLADANKVRTSILAMMNRAAQGDF